MDVDPRAEALGALVRTILSLIALAAAIRYIAIPTAIDWYRERQRVRRERYPRLDASPPERSATRHGAS